MTPEELQDALNPILGIQREEARRREYEKQGATAEYEARQRGLQYSFEQKKYQAMQQTQSNRQAIQDEMERSPPKDHADNERYQGLFEEEARKSAERVKTIEDEFQREQIELRTQYERLLG